MTDGLLVLFYLVLVTEIQNTVTCTIKYKCIDGGCSLVLEEFSIRIKNKIVINVVVVVIVVDINIS